jgi:hypothetical protein
VNVLVALAILVIVAAVAWVVSAPLRHPEAAEDPDRAERDELVAEKEAKYREIRDAELDRRTGKLDEADWRDVDRQLRAEAVAILRRLDELGGDDR